MMRPASLVMALSLVSAAGAAAEESPQAGPRETDVHRHVGFYLHPNIGFGYMTLSDAGATVSGASVLASLAIGWAVTENVLLAVEAVESFAVHPTAEGIPSSELELSLFGIGPQFTLYSADNLYFSGKFLVTHVHRRFHAALAYEPTVGPGGGISIGKEWWASDHWSLGVAVHALMSINDNPPGAYSANAQTFVVALAFSATYDHFGPKRRARPPEQ